MAVNPSVGVLSDPNALERIADFQNALSTLKLPPEIISIIIDYAEFWVVEKFALTHEMNLGCWKVDCSSPSAMLYLQTSAIGRSEALLTLPVLNPRKVVFTTESTESGANCEIENEGQYAPPDLKLQFSSLDTSVLREDEDWADEDRVEPIHTIFDEAPEGVLLWAPQDYSRPDRIHRFWEWDEDTSFPTIGVGVKDVLDGLPPWLRREEGSKTLVKHGFRLLENGDHLRWLVQSNPAGMYDPIRHVVEWTSEVKHVTDEERKGAGLGEGFIQALRRGDRIAVWARAHWSLNRVKSVQVEVHFSLS